MGMLRAAGSIIAFMAAACGDNIRPGLVGVLATCTPGAPTAELCGDNLDNDCDGASDEENCGCTAGSCDCVYVSPNGNDANPGTGTAPKLTIAAAIATAMVGTIKKVC